MTHSETSQQRTNVGALERIVSTATGSLLALNAIRKPSISKIAGAVLGADLIYRGVSGHCHLYSAMGVNTAAATKSGSEISSNAPEVRRSITIGRQADELYACWSDPAILGRVMAHFAEVTPESEGVTHWRVRGPLKQVFEWDSKQIADPGNRKLQWETLPGTQLPNRGEVSFRDAPNGIGTEVAVHVCFEPPLGAVGAQLSKALHLIPRAIAGKSLRRFKSLMETGEIPTLEHNSSGRAEPETF